MRISRNAAADNANSAVSAELVVNIAIMKV